MSRALEQADLFSALATHFRAYPHLSPVNVAFCRPGFDLQIAGFRHYGEAGGVEALLMWAKSFDRPEITVRWHDQANLVTLVAIGSRLGGQPVEVWSTERGDLHRWHTGRGPDRTTITLEQLAAYVAAGTVEHADEHTLGNTPAVTS